MKNILNNNIDCSKTINFFKELRRMCDCQNFECTRCPIYKASINDEDIIENIIEDIIFSGCNDYVCTYSDKAIEIVQKWSDEHK